MHVADLDGVREERARNRWRARVTAEVRNSDGQPVSNAIVTGNWFNGGSGSVQCTTSGNGRCELLSGNLKGNVTSISLSIASISHTAGHVYDASANTDPDGDSNGTSITVPTDGGGGNAEPVVTINGPADGSSFAIGETVTFIGSASDAEDGNITGGIQWSSSLDGALGSGGSLSVGSLREGSHQITAGITDSDGASASDAISVTISSTPPTTIETHVAALAGSSASAPRNRWSASVTITVHDAAHGPLADVTVTGSWSHGANGSSSCMTGGNGNCTLTKGGIKGNTSSARFTVTSLTGDGLTYDPADNDLPTAAVTVSRP
jgi:hypothetical protein